MIYAIAAVLVLILDQWLKYWVTVNIALDTGSITLIPGVLELVNIHNTGAAFGILQGGGWRWIFVIIALVFVVIAVYAIRRGLIRGAIGRWAVVGVLAGAIGNCIDRVLYGYVVDMFSPVFLSGTPFDAIFNVADMFISCCGILFCLYILFGREYKHAGAPVDEDEEVAKPVRQARAPRAVSGNRGGSHAKGGSHSAQSARRVPAREARSERPAASERPSSAPVPERTRIPVQQPRPQRRPAPQAQQPKVVDPNDPFAEWERPQPRSQQPNRTAGTTPAAGAAPAESGVRTAEPASPAGASAQSAQPAPSAAPKTQEAQPKKGEYEFTLEEILAEFSDK